MAEPRLVRRIIERSGQLWQTIWKRRNSWFGIAIGACVGHIGGWFGSLIGMLVGYMLDELVKQNRANRVLRGYLELPGPAELAEPAPGCAAFCALATLIVSASASRDASRKNAIPTDGASIVEGVAHAAMEVFSLGKTQLPTLEFFVNVSLGTVENLNADLLTESFAARRQRFGDIALFYAVLDSLAKGEAAKALTRRIRKTLNLGAGTLDGIVTKRNDIDPWSTLGLNPDASLDEVKSNFRKLAVRFHPDAAKDQLAPYEHVSGETFMRIESAYKEILRQKGE